MEIGVSNTALWPPFWEWLLRAPDHLTAELRGFPRKRWRLRRQWPWLVRATSARIATPPWIEPIPIMLAVEGQSLTNVNTLEWVATESGFRPQVLVLSDGYQTWAHVVVTHHETSKGDVLQFLPGSITISFD